MKKITKHIPNTLTCLNLVSGVYACISGLSGDFATAMLFVFLAALFDFLDGLAARLFNAYSPIGKDLDSLADAVSFGVAPGLMAYSLFGSVIYSAGLGILEKLFMTVSFLIPVFSVLRLAKFNVDDTQKTSFKGLPVPANAIFWASLLTSVSAVTFPFKNGLSGFSLDVFSSSQILFPIVISAFVIITSFLLVSNIPMFSLKLSSLSFKDNKLVYVLALSCLVLVLCCGISGLWLTIVLYVLLSVLFFRQSE